MRALLQNAVRVLRKGDVRTTSVSTSVQLALVPAVRQFACVIAVARMDCAATLIAMAASGNIVIADESALHLLLHCDVSSRAESLDVIGNPLKHPATSKVELESFNRDNPLYGSQPIKLLVSNAGSRRTSRSVECRRCGLQLPRGSFIRLREGLYVTSPELTFARMASRLSEVRLAEIATELCGRYYLSPGEVKERSAYLTSVESLRAYLDQLPSVKGGAKARRALRYALDNSASPMEGKTMLQFCMPLRYGAFNLPFDKMNYDIKAGRNRALSEQDSFSVDLASKAFCTAIEYDGKDSHPDSGKDKRRRNMLRALGWTIFPLEQDVLYSPVVTEKFALQVAKCVGYRMQRKKSWDDAYVRLRHELDLPV